MSENDWTEDNQQPEYFGTVQPFPITGLLTVMLIAGIVAFTMHKQFERLPPVEQPIDPEPPIECVPIEEPIVIHEDDPPRTPVEIANEVEEHGATILTPEEHAIIMRNQPEPEPFPEGYSVQWSTARSTAVFYGNHVIGIARSRLEERSIIMQHQRFMRERAEDIRR